MASRLDTITGRMSKLMLKRWSMLAEVCPEAGCSVPLMRNPETSEDMCVWHDVRKLFPEEAAAEEAAADEPEASEPDVSPTCASTLCEKLDEKLDPPATDDVLLDPPVTDEVLLRRRKREQGDLASERIGKRLLQGWAMIDRACPAESCYSVPLVQNRDKMQECVICAQRYMNEDAYVAKYGSLSNAAKPEQSVTAESKQAVAAEPKETVQVARRPADGSAVAAAVCALDDKLVVLSAQLTAAVDPGAIESIAHAIAACAKGLRECSRI
ncbi:hypothetical protein H4R19_002520 [Coemansia spiralis]|nr:hypothetical protein H4R19_002520 [Coemansia spiralis]